MDHPLPEIIRRPLSEPIMRRHLRPHRRIPPRERSAARSWAGSWVAFSPDGPAARLPALSPAAPSVPSPAHRLPHDPATIWRRAIATSAIHGDNTFWSIRVAATEASLDPDVAVPAETSLRRGVRILEL